MTGGEGASDRPWRRWAWIAAVAVLAAAALATAARLVGVESGPLAMVIALTPWFALAAAVALVLALVARSWWVAGVAVLVVALHAWWLAPLFTSSGPQGQAVVVVATVNASYGGADAHQIVALVEDRGVDILSIQELTPDLVDELATAGLGDFLPHATTRAEPDHRGIGLWSRTDLPGVQLIDDMASWAILAEVETADGAVTVFAAHPMRPGLRSHSTWSQDLAEVAQIAAEHQGPMLILGDLNATRDHAGFRTLEAQGFRDESDEAGSGLQFTFPEGLDPLPFVAIDHVLIRELLWRAGIVETVGIHGTDHRALVVTYVAK